MIGNLVSTLALREASQFSMGRIHVQLGIAATEVSSGRHHDVGLSLGRSISQTLDMRQVSGELDAITTTNGVASARLQSTQSALSSIADLANEFFSTLTASRQSPNARSQLVEDARSKIGALTSILAATSNGVALFGGISMSGAPLANYLVDPPGAPRLAIQASFVATFGIGPGDPGARSITASQMDAYLAGAFSANFADPEWQTNFSTASAMGIKDRISLTEVVETPVTANNQGIRDLVSALVAVIDSGLTISTQKPSRSWQLRLRRR